MLLIVGGWITITPDWIEIAKQQADNKVKQSC